MNTPVTSQSTQSPCRRELATEGKSPVFIPETLKWCLLVGDVMARSLATNRRQSAAVTLGQPSLPVCDELRIDGLMMDA